MQGFIAANLMISVYNLLWVVGMFACMIVGIRPPGNMWFIVGPWVGLGAFFYWLVLTSVNS